jgi:hypothetical protein
LLLSIVYLPVEATNAVQEDSAEGSLAILQVCTPPDDWGQTVRLKPPENTTKQWTFEVTEPEMDVVLVIFYYQDYDKRGCPFDCSIGECQTDETGWAETPLGNITVTDGKEGASSGSQKLEGRLTQGTYQVVFTSTAGPGHSINVGLRVTASSLPTNTPVPPTETPIPTFTATATEPEPGETSTATPMATPTDSITSAPPQPTATPTGTGEPTVLPPVPTGTTIPPDSATSTPLPTLAPPTPPANKTPAPELIPVTGIDLTSGGAGAVFYTRLLLQSGIGLLGLGLVFYGIATGLSRSKTRD